MLFVGRVLQPDAVTVTHFSLADGEHDASTDMHICAWYLHFYPWPNSMYCDGVWYHRSSVGTAGKVIGWLACRLSVPRSAMRS